MGCIVADLFGGIADSFSYTLRPDDTTSDTGNLGNGSKVAILCANARTTTPLIIGGIRDSSNEDHQTLDNSTDGHHLNFTFNGIKTKINDDGELVLTFNGKTTILGELDTSSGTSEDSAPTTVALTKDGSFEVYTKDRNQFLKLDHENHKVTFQADTEYDVTVNGTVSEDVTGSVTKTYNDTCSVTVENAIDLTSNSGAINVDASGNVNITSAGVKIGGADQAFPRFTAYRQAQQQLNNQLMTYLQQAAIQLTTAGSVISTTMVGGAMAAPSITLAAQFILQSSILLQTFEAQAETYLSTLNFND